MKKISNLLLLAGFCTLFAINQSFSQTTLLVKEAETCTLTGVTVQNSLSGYKGTGYVYMTNTGSIKFTVNVTTAGFYKLSMLVNNSLGNKDQDLYLNNALVSTLKFPNNSFFYNFDAGNLNLQAGTNTIEIKPNWGYMYFDQFTLTSVPPHDYSLTDASLVNPNANQNAKDLYAYLRSNYGKNIISGQTAYWDSLLILAKKTPVIRAFDFQHYTVGYAYKWNNQTQSHTFGWEDDGTTNAAINWYNSTNKRGIVTFQWHWHSPTGGQAGTNTFYSNQTTFDATKAATNGTAENVAIIRDIDSIATQLKKLQAAGVPVLFRPLHEAGGTWFWWGAKGSASCLALYDIVYNRITNYHKINNLIWVWSTPEADWYPGNTKVDIIGYDSYPGAYNYTTQKSIFDQLFAIVQGKKLVAMTENGPLPDIDNCIKDDAMWLYYSSWDNLVRQQNTVAHIQQVFAHTNVITLDEINTITIIEEQKAEQQIQIYPNPANDQLIISNPSFHQNLEIEIYTIVGELVHKSQLVEKQSIIDVSEFKKGIYMVKLGEENHKLVIGK